MIIDLGIYQLDIDAERTAAFYSSADGIGCDCDGCQNYAQAVSFLPEPVLRFLQQFGIDPAKPAEVYIHYAPSRDTAFYGGFYHVCGRILKGTNPWIQTGKKSFSLDERYRVHLSENCSVFITDEIQLLEDGFPAPVVQIEIEFILPWVLQIPNTYTID